MQPTATWAEPAPWLFCITVDQKEFGRSRDELIGFLGAEGIETRPFFIPLHTLPPFRQEAASRGTSLPVTDGLAACGLNLPTHTQLTTDQISFIASKIASFGRPSA
jgi:perosamine synthetase